MGLPLRLTSRHMGSGPPTLKTRSPKESLLIYHRGHLPPLNKKAQRWSGLLPLDSSLDPADHRAGSWASVHLQNRPFPGPGRLPLCHHLWGLCQRELGDVRWEQISAEGSSVFLRWSQHQPRLQTSGSGRCGAGGGVGGAAHRAANSSLGLDEAPPTGPGLQAEAGRPQGRETSKASRR